ncbi:MAG: hypothetical protein QXZ70_05310 [Candidatus Bathyarchaeia archaeon]
MRSYIFTDRERNAILRFFKDKKRSQIVNYLAFEIDANWHVLLTDFKLLIKFKRALDAGY